MKSGAFVIAAVLLLGPMARAENLPAPASEPAAAREDVARVRESLAFEHVEIAIVKKACAIGTVCTASWRIDSGGRIVHRDGERLYEGTVPADTLAVVAALAVSADVVTELRRPEPCPDRSRVVTEIEVGFVPGLAATTQTGDCTSQGLGNLTSTLRRVAKTMFPASRSSDDLMPQFPQGPPALGLSTPPARHRRPVTAVALASPMRLPGRRIALAAAGS
jgi:hypothetical protein